MSEKIDKKKKLLIVVAIVFGVLIVTSALVVIIELFEKDSTDNGAPKPIKYNFYAADYTEDIYSDKEYTELIEGDFLRYLDMSTNRTVGIKKENAYKYSEDVIFMIDYIDSIIQGNHKKYNSMFSEDYYEHNSSKGVFTKQKLYDIQISKYSSEKKEEDGKSFTSYIYIVEYRIFKNNGTFRNDIGDGSRKQYITITDKSGDLLIDSIGYESRK